MGVILSKLNSKLTGVEEKKRLASNIVSLSVLQATNYLLPLLTLPYLVRVLGPEYFGLLSFATATITYFMLIADYGFNLSATRQISIHREDKEKVNDIFSSVMTIKVALLVVGFLLMSLLILNFDKFSEDSEVYYITFGVVIGQALFPVWLFQGMERMKYITYLNIGAKVFFTVCIFVFVREQTDYLMVPIFTAMGFIVAGVWSLFLVKNTFDVHFKWQSLEAINYQLSEGWHVFFSSLSISLYTTSTTFILGLLTNNIVVGYFAAANKIVQAVKGFYVPISQAIYPLVSKKMNYDKKSGLKFVGKVTWFVGLGMFLISTVLFIFAEPIIYLLMGEQYKQSILLLQIMSFLPFIIALSNIFGIQIMLNLGYKREFALFVSIFGTAGVGLALLLTTLYKAEGVSISMLLVETLITVTLGLFILFKKRKGTL